MRLQLLRNLEFWQSVGYKSIWTQSSLLVTFVYKAEIPVRRLEHHAQSPANTASVLPRDPSNRLRGNGTAAAFFAAMDTNPSPQCRLSSLRPHPRSSVRHHGWPATHQQNRDSAIQRNFSFPLGPGLFSRSIHLASLSQANPNPSDPSVGRPARPLASPTLSVTPAAYDPNLRSRFGRADHLRQTAVCPCGVQPSQTGPAFLPPPGLFRGSSAGVLAWVAAAWQYGEQHRAGPLPEI